jgi:hypothetical protein
MLDLDLALVTLPLKLSSFPTRPWTKGIHCAVLPTRFDMFTLVHNDRRGKTMGDDRSTHQPISSDSFVPRDGDRGS